MTENIIQKISPLFWADVKGFRLPPPEYWIDWIIAYYYHVKNIVKGLHEFRIIDKKPQLSYIRIL
jgi:hypothetical protein